MNEEHNNKGRGIYLLPNLLTLTALFAGFYAIVAGMKGLFDDAAIAIFVAMIMDTLDGRVARLTHTQTAFGAQLDSLSDMVSFGLAPALILYAWGLNALGKAGWLVTFFYAACVALRLARFNVQHDIVDKRYFKGLPCPPAAAVIASMLWSVTQYDLKTPQLYIVASIFTVLISLLMVSNIPYYSFKDFNPKNKVPFIFILLALLLFVIISANPPLVGLILALLYAASGPISFLSRWRKKRNL